MCVNTWYTRAALLSIETTASGRADGQTAQNYIGTLCVRVSVSEVRLPRCILTCFFLFFMYIPSLTCNILYCVHLELLLSIR